MGCCAALFPQKNPFPPCTGTPDLWLAPVLLQRCLVHEYMHAAAKAVRGGAHNRGVLPQLPAGCLAASRSLHPGSCPPLVCVHALPGLQGPGGAGGQARKVQRAARASGHRPPPPLLLVGAGGPPLCGVGGGCRGEQCMHVINACIQPACNERTVLPAREQSAGRAVSLALCWWSPPLSPCPRLPVGPASLPPPPAIPPPGPLGLLLLDRRAGRAAGLAQPARSARARPCRGVIEGA